MTFDELSVDIVVMFIGAPVFTFEGNFKRTSQIASACYGSPGGKEIQENRKWKYITGKNIGGRSCNLTNSFDLKM